jgi:hypothetical protein
MASVVPLWRADKAGPGVAVDFERLEATRQGPGWGVQLIDLWVSETTEPTANIVLEFAGPLPGEVYVGVVGRNYDPKRVKSWKGIVIDSDQTGWDDALFDNKLAVVFESKTGKQYHKGSERPNGAMVPFGSTRASCRFSFQFDMANLKMACSVLGDKPNAEPVATVEVDDLPSEVAVAVAFGPTAIGKLLACTIVQRGELGDTDATGPNDSWTGGGASRVTLERAKREEVSEEVRMARQLS